MAARVQLTAEGRGELDVETDQIAMFVRAGKGRIVLQDSHTQIVPGKGIMGWLAEKRQQEQQTERHEKPAQG